MKYIMSNGLKLEVREISEPIYKLEIESKNFPLPIILQQIVSDDEARLMVRRIDKTNYKKVDCEKSDAAGISGQDEHSNQEGA